MNENLIIFSQTQKKIQQKIIFANAFVVFLNVFNLKIQLPFQYYVVETRNRKGKI